MAQYDAIVVGTPTRFGRMSSQMASFWDTAGGVWAQGLLTGKVGAAFTSSAAQRGGQETPMFNILNNLLHFGDRKSVRQGTHVSVRVDLGGRRKIKKQQIKIN